jgi:hypothetical protein
MTCPDESLKCETRLPRRIGPNSSAAQALIGRTFILSTFQGHNRRNTDRRSTFSRVAIRENKMKFVLLGAAAIAAAALLTPVQAQEVIYNPGYCAQFYPNANCQNKGPGNPYTGSYQARRWRNDYAYMGHWREYHPRRHHHYRVY